MLKTIKSKLYFIEYISIIIWSFILKNTKFYFSQFFSAYLFCGLFAIFCIFFLHKNNFSLKNFEFKRDKALIVSFSLLFSLIILLANYKKLILLSSIKLFFIAFILIFSSFVIWKNISIFFVYLSSKISNTSSVKKAISKKSELIVFFTSFIVISLINIFVLFSITYPGGISYPDSKNQIDQIMSGVYTNHHPFWHTMIIKMCLNLGKIAFGSFNIGIAFYSIFQIIIMALCFSYSVLTIYQIRKTKIPTIISILFFSLAPYHIVYSFTMWKDTLFAGILTVFVTALLRIFKNIGNNKINYILMTIGALGFAILRNNGFLALIFTFLVFLISFRKKYLNIKLILLSVIIVSFILTNPVLKALDVKPTENGESLSIPTQQIARVVEDDCELTDYQTELIEKVVSIDSIKSEYLPYISDPIKKYVNQSEFFDKNKSEYLKLWVQLGVKYPSKFIAAWVDQTVGYWNCGYDYWLWDISQIKFEDYNIHTTENIHLIRSIFDKYISLSYLPFIQIIYCVGFNFWIIVQLFITSVLNRKKEFILTVPIIAIILTLLIATPVFCEFRYAYAIFTCLPIIFTGCMTSGKNSINKKHKLF